MGGWMGKRRETYLRKSELVVEQAAGGSGGGRTALHHPLLLPTSDLLPIRTHFACLEVGR